MDTKDLALIFVLILFVLAAGLVLWFIRFVWRRAVKAIKAMPDEPKTYKSNDSNIAPSSYEDDNPQPHKPEQTSTENNVSVEKIPFDICTKNLDEAKGVIQVQGSNPEPYTVDLSNLSCTCMDFIEKRSGFPVNDIRRVCKHQAGVIAKSKQFQAVETADVFRKILELWPYDGVRIYEDAFGVTVNESTADPNGFHILTKAEYGWADIHLPGERFCYCTDYGNQRRYEYNLKQKRWAGGNNPFPHGQKPKYNNILQDAWKSQKEAQ
jgi:hypothetical protein